MGTRLKASHPTPADRWKAGLILVGVLSLSYLGFEYLPWPRFTDSGWLVALLLVAGGAMLDWVLGGRRGPDAASVASMLCYGGGALVMQGLVHIAAAFGL